MEVLPVFVVVVAALVWLWLREPDKQVTADEVQREGADAPSPRASEGHSGHVQLAWSRGADGTGTANLRALDPDTGEPIDEQRARLESHPFEVVDVVDVDSAAVRRGDLAPGEVLLVKRADAEASAEVELRTADTGERVGRVAPDRACHLAGMVDRGHRFESMVLRTPAADPAATVAALVTERGVLPPLPTASQAGPAG